MPNEGGGGGSGADDDEALGAWALRYRGVATFGALALLLGTGKFVGFHWYQLPLLRRAVIPPAVVSGVLGCVVYRLFKGLLSPGLKSCLDESLSEVVVLMINFTFSALTLGFASVGTYVPRTRAVLASIWHEALPMLVYSQVLIWGQSCVALLTVGLIRLGNPDVSAFLGALVTMGLETGRDVMSFSTKEIAGDWADEVVRLADSMGLLLSIFGGICLMTVHMGGWGHTGARGYSLVGDDAAAGAVDGLLDGSGGVLDRDAGRQREHFDRARGKCGWLVGRGSADRSSTGGHGLGGAGAGRGRLAGGDDGDDDDVGATTVGRTGGSNNHRSRSLSPRYRPPLRGAGVASGSMEAGAAEAGVAGRDRGPTLGIHRAGLGAHLLLPAVSVGAAWLLDLFIRAVENNVEWTAKHHIISGFRLFQLSMCTALLFMCVIRRTSPFRYHSEWFFRLSGLCLDLMTTAAISSIGFASIPDKFNAAFLLVLLACVLWNVVVFIVLAPRMFPNFWLLRAMALIGDALGHSWVGLLLLRAMDFRLQTPVPLAYAYKTMMFFIPASGTKNAIVVAMVDVMGVWEAFLVCLVVCAAWLWVFDWHFKGKMPHNQQMKESERSKKLQRSPLIRKKVSEEVELVDMRPPGLGGVDVESSIEEDAKEVTLDQPSKILTAARLRRLAEAIPLGQAMKTWRLGYSIARDGASLWTLLQNCQGRGPSLIVVEDSWGYVFGGFVGSSIKESQDYYGTGESFVYSFNPTFKAHRWTGVNDYFCISSESWLAMGGGGGGFAFQIDDELDAGESNPSDTFGSPRLSSNEFFRCLQVEVWYFSDLKPGGV